MSPAEFEHAIPAIERPQTHALDSTATGIGGLICIIINIVSYERFGRRHLFSCSEGGPGCFSADWVTACVKLRYIKYPKRQTLSRWADYHEWWIWHGRDLQNLNAFLWWYYLNYIIEIYIANQYNSHFYETRSITEPQTSGSYSVHVESVSVPPLSLCKINCFVILQSASNFSTRTWYASFITSLLTLPHFVFFFFSFCWARIWCCLPVPMFWSFKTVILFSSRPTSLLLLALCKLRNVHYLLSWLQFPCFFPV